MRRAYVEAEIPPHQATMTALEWAGSNATIHVPDTGSVDVNTWIERLGVPISCSSSKSRFYGVPRGTVIGFMLSPPEVFKVEQARGIDGLVVVGAYRRRTATASTAMSHSPWITAFGVEWLGGEPIAPIPAASAPLRAAVAGLSRPAVGNQGLSDKRERHAAVQALTHLRVHGVALDPDALMVEALRRGWGGDGPAGLRAVAVDLNHGKALQFTDRVTPQGLNDWLNATD